MEPIQKKIISNLFFLFIFALSAFASPFAQGMDWEKFASLPVQHEGRVKPLDTFARLFLFQFSGKTNVKTSESQLSASQWMAEVLFCEERASTHPIFLVDNPEVLDRLGMPYQKMRARYAYRDFAPHLPQLKKIVFSFREFERSRLTIVEAQMARLYENLEQFRKLLDTFGFLKGTPPSSPEMEKIVGPSPCLVDYLKCIKATEEKQTKDDETNLLGRLKNETLRFMNLRYSNLFACLPPEGHEKWKSPWEAFLQTASDGKSNAGLEILSSLYQSYEANRTGPASASFDPFFQWVVSRGALDHDTISREVRYNEYDLFFKALAAYLCSMLLCCVSWHGKAGKAYLFSIFVLIAGYLAHSYGIMMRMQIKGRPPVSNLYETLIFVCWMSITLSFVLESYLYKKIKTLGLFAGGIVGVSLLFISRKYEFDGDQMGVLIAVLDSNFWLASHVTTIVIGYSACLVAGALGHLFLFLNLFPATARKFDGDLDRMTYGILCFGLVFSFLGTVLGGFWADQSWGRFWGWDPKENGALLLVLWIAILIHARLGGYLKPWGLALGAIFGNIVVAAAWWGVNLLNIGLHSYGFTSGMAMKLALFAFIELGIIIAGAFLSRLLKRTEGC